VEAAWWRGHELAGLDRRAVHQVAALMVFIIGLTILLLVTIQLSDLVCAGIILAGEAWERWR
jgi:hypothetical protein